MRFVDRTREQLQEEATKLYIRAAQLLDPLRLQVWEERGITFPQLRILFRTRAQPGIDLQTLATGLGMSASAASQQVDKLVNRGFILRTEDPQDRRRIRLEISDLGQQVTGEISRSSRRYLESLLAALSDDELADLERLLSRLLATAPQPFPLTTASVPGD